MSDPFAAEPASSPVARAETSSADAAPATLTTASLETSNGNNQNSQSLSTVRVPSIQPATPPKVIPVQDMPSHRKWLALSIAQHSAAAFDAYSTRRAISSGAHEADPLMRPFAQSPGIYAAIQACPLVLDYASRRMQRSSNSFMRRTWWVPQSAATGLFLFSGFHNLSVANQH
ncbi:MAG TPA: hypothetical protein VMM16_11360 [Verrucomicrobiae bacterium]|nr:hypothetical protein [Verrucomicrobiae bacterium]